MNRGNTGLISSTETVLIVGNISQCQVTLQGLIDLLHPIMLSLHLHRPGVYSTRLNVSLHSSVAIPENSIHENCWSFAYEDLCARCMYQVYG